MDRAALDVALQSGIPCGGWCPRGRRAEDGTIDERYPLRETPDSDYAQRTEWNVHDSDGTLILTRGEPTGGTSLTAGLARKAGKPVLVVDLDAHPALVPAPDDVAEWIARNRIAVLNVAGPRESQQPGIRELATEFLARLCGEARNPHGPAT